MRYAILSDIHGNLDALQAVLEALHDERIDAVACLGDIVGYGPEPRECLRAIRKYDSLIIAGNHDYAVANKIDIEAFNAMAREATCWTRKELSASEIEFLGNLPLVAHLDTCDLVHGSLYSPELFDYVQNSYDAHLTMSRMRSSVCFIGHSHVPVNFLQTDIIAYNFLKEIRLLPGAKVIVNVGSVGQPRDYDPRACFAVYDSEEQLVRVRRVEYDIDAVAAKIQKAGLPPALGERLRLGR